MGVRDELHGYLVCMNVEGRDDRWEPQSFFFWEPQALEYIEWAESINPHLRFYLWTSTFFSEYAAARSRQNEIETERLK